ncbi:MAG: 3-dehydroquinate synthase [Leptospira sp.]|nr:3-dehydroquinate synthase [Leptospira sp.]
MLLSAERIKFGNTDYNILLHEDFRGLSEELAKFPGVSRYIVITEKKIASLFLKDLLKEISGLKIEIHIIYIPGKEKNKHIDKLKKTYHELLTAGADRKSVILALGGGVVGDYAGFVAATFLRGIRFIQIPTTLLACVDSSVGGKVAVNLDRGKNMVGAFYQPLLVYAPLFALGTLPKKEWRCGLAEVLKHSLLSGGTLFEVMKNHSFSDVTALSEITRIFISESVRYKASVVAEDEKETGKRAVLNLGHTTAHAIESATNYEKYSHGEAVSIGLVTALFLSVEKEGLPSPVLDIAIEIMKKYTLPFRDQTRPEKIIRHMQHDKKTENRILKFVLLKKVGEPTWGNAISEMEILEALNKQAKLA